MARGDRLPTMPTRVAGVLALVLGAPPAYGQAPDRAPPSATARLTYSVRAAKDACPDEASFRALVVARIGRDPFAEGASDSVEVAIDADAKGARGRLTITRARSKPAERRFSEAPNGCEPLTEAIATATALAIDPVAATAPPSPPAPPPSPPEPPAPSALPPPPPEPKAEPSNAPSSPLAEEIHFAARGALVGALGVAPSPTGGAEVAVGLARGAFSLFVEGRAETTLAPTRGDTGDRLEATLLGVGLAPCGRMAALFACVVGRVGVFQGRGPDLPHEALGSSTQSSVGPRVGVWLPLGSGLALVALGEVDVALVRTTLLVDARAAWTAPPIGGGLSVGIGLVTDRSR